ncbi:hypothetical protein ZWY2020_034052 [Hordeum vulgare]|nr:hypothetical protein ZWY2020_034052 [Hordeum vulgare]
MSTDSDTSLHHDSNSFRKITSYRLGLGDRAVAADRNEQVPLVDPSLDPVLLVLGIGIGDSILEAVDEAGTRSWCGCTSSRRPRVSREALGAVRCLHRYVQSTCPFLFMSVSWISELLENLM